MQKTITIQKDEMLKRARLQIAYEADRHPELSGRYSEVLMKTTDSELAEVYLSAAMSRLSNMISVYCPNAYEKTKQGEKDVLNIVLTLPSNYDVSAMGLMEEAVSRYLESKIISEWMQKVAPANAAPWGEQIVMASADIRKALTRRARPKRDVVPPLDTISVTYE